MPDIVNEDMIQIFLSDFLATSGGYSEWQAGQLKQFITSNDIPNTSPIQLNTTYFSDLIPPLYNKYPNTLMDLNVSVVSMPTVFFNTSGAFVTATAHCDTYVVINNSPVYAFTLEVITNLAGNANIKGTTIYGDLTFLAASVSLYKSAIGQFSTSNLNDVVQLLISFVLPDINDKLANGFQLPITDGVALVSPSLTWGSRYLVVSTNVQYIGNK